MKIFSFLMGALLLAACGGGSKSPEPVAVQPPPAPAPPMQADAFFASLSGIVNTTSDDAEPGSVDTLAATVPEDSEPQPVWP